MKNISITRLFSPFGRLGRRTYWIAVPVLLAIRIAADYAAEQRLQPAILPILIGLIGGWTLFTVITRRLHDIGLDVLGLYLGWVAFWIVGVLLLAGLHFGLGWDGDLLASILGVVFFLAQVGILIWIGAQRGNPHKNQHGWGGSAVRSDAPTGYVTP